MHGDEYSKLWILERTAQNCSKLFKSTYTCPQKSAQNCSKLLKLIEKYLYLPKKNAQNCLKSTYTCPKNLLKIAQNCSKWLKMAQNCSKMFKMFQNVSKCHFEKFWGDFETFCDILRHFETFWDILRHIRW